MAEVTLGGERLGSGNKNKAYLHNYERSTHDMSYIWRSTMASGTLVPFMSELALPGDTFDINLDCDILTHPTIGPLFGSYKIQLDVFQVPIRLYQPQLHMNLLGIGLDMSAVKLPQVELWAPVIDKSKPIDNQQVNASCIFSYLGIRGCGINTAEDVRQFNAVPYLAYWDIYKNYYANKQEEVGVVIHKEGNGSTPTISSVTFNNLDDSFIIPSTLGQAQTVALTPNTYVNIVMNDWDNNFDPSTITIHTSGSFTTLDNIFSSFSYNPLAGTILGYNCNNGELEITHYSYEPLVVVQTDTEPQLYTFNLNAIDDMRTNILRSTSAPFIINYDTPEPYNLPLMKYGGDPVTQYSQQFNQEGLACKTYQSDLFNNWISTEWLDGTGGINELTAITVTNNEFTINELMLNRKIYDMLMRVAVSGGSYDDWLDAVYTHDRIRSAENPMYIGGLIKNLVFQEVISTAPAMEQPLGTLAGRGRLGSKHKGGNIVAKIDEPSYLIGIISLTPNVDYSQGNKWDVNLKTLDDLHKPGLDQIGFQNLITDQMAWFDTQLADGEITTKSAGKLPAWINYMTNVNQVKGNFADELSQGFMILNRSYEPLYNNDGTVQIKDLTTYIDPSKFNHIFADTRRDAQNFWSQISIDMKVRRKISAKTIPNL